MLALDSVLVKSSFSHIPQLVQLKGLILNYVDCHESLVLSKESILVAIRELKEDINNDHVLEPYISRHLNSVNISDFPDGLIEIFG